MTYFLKVFFFPGAMHGVVMGGALQQSRFPSNFFNTWPWNFQKWSAVFGSLW
jgi:hypothetical protein